MAKTKKPNARGRKRGEQTHIDGMGPEKNPKVHGLAIEYVRARDARMDLTKEEVACHGRLLAVMQAEGLTEYEYDDVKVRVDSTHNVKVKKAGEKDEQE